MIEHNVRPSGGLIIMYRFVQLAYINTKLLYSAPKRLVFGMTNVV
jgi:hypothetical protein